MKKLIILFLFLLVGCSNIPDKSWKKIESKNNFFNIETGDIILKEKQVNFLGMFGHTGVMKNDRLVVNYPKWGKNIEIIDINYWLEKNRRFMILRYIGMDKKFKEKFIEILDRYIELNLPYQINFDTKSERGFYCSQFIWFIYYRTASELGIKLKEEEVFMYLPYDFIHSKDFYIVF